MDANKAAYWIALGVLALGLNSQYRQGNFPALHRASDRAGSVLCKISSSAERTLAAASVLMREQRPTRDNLLLASDGAEMARDQAELFRNALREQVRGEIQARADVIRAAGEMRRAQIEQIRSRNRLAFQFAGTSGHGMTVVCPKTGVGIIVNRTSSDTD